MQKIKGARRGSVLAFCLSPPESCRAASQSAVALKITLWHLPPHALARSSKGKLLAGFRENRTLAGIEENVSSSRYGISTEAAEAGRLQPS